MSEQDVRIKQGFEEVYIIGSKKVWLKLFKLRSHRQAWPMGGGSVKKPLSLTKLFF